MIQHFILLQKAILVHNIGCFLHPQMTLWHRNYVQLLLFGRLPRDRLFLSTTPLIYLMPPALANMRLLLLNDEYFRPIHEMVSNLHMRGEIIWRISLSPFPIHSGRATPEYHAHVRSYDSTISGTGSKCGFLWSWSAFYPFPISSISPLYPYFSYGPCHWGRNPQKKLSLRLREIV